MIKMKLRRNYLIIFLLYILIYLSSEAIAVYLKWPNTVIFTLSMTVFTFFLIIYQRKRHNILTFTDRNMMILKGIGWSLVLLTVEIILLASVVIINRNNMLSNQHTDILVDLIKQQKWYLCYLALVAPILEELVFRESLYELLKGKNRITAIFAAIIVAALFSVIHQDKAWLGYFLVSLFLQWEYVHYRDIRYSMITHGVLNAVSLIIIFLA